MDRPGGGGRDEAEGSEARARVGATGGDGRDRGGRWARGPRQASIALLRRGRRPDRLLRFTAGPGAGELRDGPRMAPDRQSLPMPRLEAPALARRPP